MEINHCVTPQTKCVDFISASGVIMNMYDYMQTLSISDDNQREATLDELQNILFE